MKKLTITFLSILFLSFFLYPVISQTNNTGGNTEKKNLTLEDIWVKRNLSPKGMSGLKSMKDGENYTLLEDNEINQYSYKTGKKVKTILKKDNLIPEGQSEPINIEEYAFSEDETKVLISNEKEPIYRHSEKDRNYIYDLKKNKFTAVAKEQKQQLTTFSPDGNHLAYVRNNNLFIYEIESGNEIQITQDGLINHIINGAPDWVYEEEFGFGQGYQWSPDGKKIAFYRFDESHVKEFTLLNYGKLYPELYKFKYPKAGENNSLINIFTYDLSSGKTVKMDIGKDTDIYIPRIKWTNNPNSLCIYRMNRLQNKLEMLLANAVTGETSIMYTEENKCYIEIDDDLVFLKDGLHFINTTVKNGFNQICMFDMKGNLTRQITTGNYDVIQFNGIDEKNNIIYYMASETVPYQNALYSIGIDGKNKKKLSVNIGINDVSFSNNFKYYVNGYSNANTPKTVTVNEPNGKVVRVMEDNNELKEKLKEYNISNREFFKFSTSENIDLYGWMIKPSNFDPSKKYPVLMYVYGGPGGNTVFDRWDYMDLWYQLLAEKGYIIVSVDNRGTAYRGEAFRKSTYMQLGKLETIDQIETAKYLSSLSYVDSKRIGIWGWSFGGYLSASCILKGADVFKLAIAVAPVTNWRYYDNIYTERYMRTPQENPTGYDDNSPVNFAKNLKGKLLICHGESDDNVHIQNSMMLIKALNDNAIQFDMHIYPNKNHNISGGKTRLHLFTKMTDYILSNL